MERKFKQQTVLAKVILVGDSTVGKTSLLSRFISDSFKEATLTTDSPQLFHTTLELPERAIRLSLWDTAGQEIYRSICRVYYQGAQGALVCFDFTSAESFANVSMWLRELKEHASADIQLVLVGTKWDREDKEVILHDARKFAEDLSIPFIYTSAKTNFNIRESIECVAQRILSLQPPSPLNHQSTRSLFSLRQRQPQKKRKKCCH